MSVLYLHGGMQKTGTSSIQRFLAKNREALRLQNTVFPDFGDLYHFDNASDVRNAYWISRINLKAQTFADYSQGIERIGALSQSYEKIILSDEMLWRNKFTNKKFWTDFQKALEPYDITIKVIVYLRRQDEYVYSMWGQMVKSPQEGWKNDCTFAQFLKEGYGERTPLDYPCVLDVIEHAIGKDNIILRVFEQEQFFGEEHSLVLDFCHAAGLSAHADAYTALENSANISLKDAVLETKRQLNRLPEFCDLTKSQGNTLNRHLRAVQTDLAAEGLLGSRDAFSAADRRAYLQRFEESNKAVARRYLDRADGRLFYRQVSPEDSAGWEFEAEELNLVCGRIIAGLLKDLDRELEAKKECRQKADASDKADADSGLRSLKRKLRNHIRK